MWVKLNCNYLSTQIPLLQQLFYKRNHTTAAVQQTGQEVKEMANVMVMLATVLMAVCAGIKLI